MSHYLFEGIKMKPKLKILWKYWFHAHVFVGSRTNLIEWRGQEFPK